jgi:hypothetical protein
MATGLVLLILGAVLLIRGHTHGPDTNVEAAGVKFIASPAAMLLIAGVLLLGGGGFFLAQTVVGQPTAVNTPPPSPVITPAPTSATPSSQPTVPFANVTYPPDGTKVSRQNGFVMGGTVADPGPFTIWILDHPSPDSYFVDVKATIQNGDWSAADMPLGDASDALPFTMTVVAVTADPECARALNQAGASPATSHLDAMPHGCYQFGQVTVNVTRP